MEVNEVISEEKALRRTEEEELEGLECCKKDCKAEEAFDASDTPAGDSMPTVTIDAADMMREDLFDLFWHLRI